MSETDKTNNNNKIYDDDATVSPILKLSLTNDSNFSNNKESDMSIIHEFLLIKYPSDQINNPNDYSSKKNKSIGANEAKNEDDNDEVNEFTLDNDDDDNDENDDDDDEEEAFRYELEQGENWLRLITKRQPSVLDETQTEVSQQQQQQAGASQSSTQQSSSQSTYPSILSVLQLGNVNAPSSACHLCIDVDDSILTIKDMRKLPDDKFEAFGQDDQENHGDFGILRKTYGPVQKNPYFNTTDWIPLPRRQLRVLHAGDHICTTLSSGVPSGLIFEYHKSSIQSTYKSPSCDNSDTMDVDSDDDNNNNNAQENEQENNDDDNVICSTESQPKTTIDPSEQVVSTPLAQIKTNTNATSPMPSSVMTQPPPPPPEENDGKSTDSDRTVVLERNKDGLNLKSLSSTLDPVAEGAVFTQSGEHDNKNEVEEVVDKNNDNNNDNRHDNVDESTTIDKATTNKGTNNDNKRKESTSPKNVSPEQKHHTIDRNSPASPALSESLCRDTGEPPSSDDLVLSLQPKLNDDENIDGSDTDVSQDLLSQDDTETDSPPKKRQNNKKRKNNHGMENDQGDKRPRTRRSHDQSPSSEPTKPEEKMEVEEVEQENQKHASGVTKRGRRGRPKKVSNKETGNDDDNGNDNTNQNQDKTEAVADDAIVAQAGRRRGRSKTAKTSDTKSEEPNNTEENQTNTEPPMEPLSTRGGRSTRQTKQTNKISDSDEANHTKNTTKKLTGTKTDAKDANATTEAGSKQSGRRSSSRSQKAIQKDNEPPDNSNGAQTTIQDKDPGGRNEDDENGKVYNTPSKSEQSEEPAPKGRKSKLTSKKSEPTPQTDVASRTVIPPKESARLLSQDSISQHSSASSRRASKRRAVSLEASSSDTSPPPSRQRRKTSTASSLSVIAGDRDDICIDAVRVLVTGFTISEKHKKMVESIGGILLEKVNEAPQATHVIASDGECSLRRTPKLMIGLCTTSNIVTLDWLIESAKANQVLPSKDYYVTDTAAESQYGFKMVDTIQRGNFKRSNGDLLFQGKSFHVCSGVAGNKAPPTAEFKLIIEAAGGSWLPVLPTITKKRKKETSMEDDPMKYIVVITSKVDNEAKKQVKNRKVAAVLEMGAVCKTTEDIFSAIMNQQIEF